LPVMSGLSATEFIMAHCPTPILVVSASTNRGELFKIYDTLSAGAVDVLEKLADLDDASVWARRLIAMVKTVSKIRVITHPRARLNTLRKTATEVASRISDKAQTAPSLSIVAIGASTGGPAAIVEVLRALPPAFPMPILVVLHINEPFGAA